MTDLTALVFEQQSRIWNDFGLIAITATELEFYIPGATESGLMPTIWRVLEETCKQRGFELYNMESEKGPDQFEIALQPHAEVTVTAERSVLTRMFIENIAGKFGLEASFAAKPYADQPGSGLHAHISLYTEEGKNVYFKDDENISPELYQSIGGILAWLPYCMPVFCPSDASYARFTSKSNAPTTISWGANNRTVAVRLPDSSSDDKHIELRVPGADADPYKVLSVMLAAVHDGLSNQIEPSQQIYGDADLEQYALPRLPMSATEAFKNFIFSERVGQYFSFADLLTEG